MKSGLDRNAQPLCHLLNTPINAAQSNGTHPPVRNIQNRQARQYTVRNPPQNYGFIALPVIAIAAGEAASRITGQNNKVEEPPLDRMNRFFCKVP
ncbi:hypothetical protein J3459_022548 [Metarhizium acridum]|nr:hypothetical protein J3459_022548 [Metarhizium acridum]